MEKKRCSKCGSKKSLEKFGTFSHPITGKKSYQAWCRECFRVYVKARRARQASEESVERRVPESVSALGVSDLLERHREEP